MSLIITAGYGEKDFWEGYTQMRNQFKDGEYVLFRGKELIKRSMQPIYEQTCVPFNGLSEEQGYDVVHQVFQDDVEFNNNERETMDKTFNMPDEYMQQIKKILDKAERQTGESYHAEIYQQGATDKYTKTNIINDLEHRNGYEVYCMKPKYKALEGKYETIADIKAKLKSYCGPYDFASVDIKGGCIYTSGGGSISICHTLGFVRIYKVSKNKNSRHCIIKTD